MNTPTHTRLFVVRGDLPRMKTWPPSLRERDSLRKFFDGEFQTAIISMCAKMKRQPSTKFHEIRRDKARNGRPWGALLLLIDEVLIAGAPLDRVLVLADLLRDYANARGAERPQTAAEAMLEDMQLDDSIERKVA